MCTDDRYFVIMWKEILRPRDITVRRVKLLLTNRHETVTEKEGGMRLR